jgi:hypothetical protein
LRETVSLLLFTALTASESCLRHHDREFGSETMGENLETLGGPWREDDFPALRIWPKHIAREMCL